MDTYTQRICTTSFPLYHYDFSQRHLIPPTSCHRIQSTFPSKHFPFSPRILTRTFASSSFFVYFLHIIAFISYLGLGMDLLLLLLLDATHGPWLDVGFSFTFFHVFFYVQSVPGYSYRCTCHVADRDESNRNVKVKE